MKYTRKLEVLKLKFADVSQKYQTLLNYVTAHDSNSTNAIFSSFTITPEQGITQDEQNTLKAFVTKVCNIGHEKLETECKNTTTTTNTKYVNTATNTATPLPYIERQDLLESVEKLLDEEDLFDIEDTRSQEKSVETLKEELAHIIDAQLFNLRYLATKPEIAAVNVLTRDFREAAFSLAGEFASHKTLTLKQNEVRKSYLKTEFSSTNDLLKQIWSRSDAKTQSNTAQNDGKALSTYANKGSLQVVANNLKDVEIHSPEAMENLKTIGKDSANAQFGLLAVQYIKDYALPNFFKALCVLHAPAGTFAKVVDQTITLKEAKFAAANFYSLFEGIDNDYYSTIDSLIRNMDIDRVKVKQGTVDQYDFAKFVEGLEQLADLVHKVEVQHDFDSTPVSLADFCPDIIKTNDSKITTTPAITNDQETSTIDAAGKDATDEASNRDEL